MDHIQTAISRLATQYKESSRLVSYITAILGEFPSLEAAMQQEAFKFSIDDATGDVLDIIGDIVGQPRTLVDEASLGSYFGFTDNGTDTAGVLTFGDQADASIGGRFRGSSDDAAGFVSVDDATFRIMIRAKIKLNGSIGSLQDAVDLYKFILYNQAPGQVGTLPQITINEVGPAKVTVGFAPAPTDAQRYALNHSAVHPLPAGVGIDYFYTYDPSDVFSFLEDANGQGFGSGTMIDSSYIP